MILLPVIMRVLHHFRWGSEYVKTVALLLLLSFLLLGQYSCITTEEKVSAISEPQKAREADDASQEAARVQRVLEENRLRNATFKKSAEWLQEAYRGLMVRRLNDIPRGDFSAYRQYLVNQEVYIIVHPGYFAFFENENPYPPRETTGLYPAENLMERIGRYAASEHQNLLIMVEEERLLREFLEFMAADKRLVILILPGDFRRNVSAKTPGGPDEYVRYINDLTNGSESIIYMETEKQSSGYLTRQDLESLSTFLAHTGAKRVMFGGGYVGKCLDNFFSQFAGIFRQGNVYLVPEISAVSPMDGSFDGMLREDGSIHMGYKIKVLKMHGTSIPRIKRFPLFRLSKQSV